MMLKELHSSEASELFTEALRCYITSKVVHFLLVGITEPNRNILLVTSCSPCCGWSPGADGASALLISALFFFFLSVSNWFLINNCNQSRAFTPSSPLTVGANLEGCEYFWAHSPHAARYHEPKALSTNHMKDHECRIGTISKTDPDWTEWRSGLSMLWIFHLSCSWFFSQISQVSWTLEQSFFCTTLCDSITLCTVCSCSDA